MSLGLQVGYAALFFAPGLLALWGVSRVRRIDDPEVRRGLAALLVLSKVWVMTELARVLLGSGALAVAFYTFGLVVGLAAVGAWVYFAAAYAGRSFHRNPRLRAASIGAFLLAVGVKVTNPLHGQYLSTTAVVEPFSHLAVTLSPVHWAIATASYLVAGYGIYLVGRTLADTTDADSVTALLLLAVTLPALCSLVGEFTPLLLPFNYEPIGAVGFGVAVLVVADGSLLSVDRVGRHQTFGDLSQPVVILDAEDRVREFNTVATRLFPDLRRYRPVEGAFETLLAETDGENPAPLECGGETRWFVVEVSAVTVGTVALGRSYVLTDVTEVEGHRRELERQNRQLEELNMAVQHELRNSLTALLGYTDLARRNVEAGDDRAARDDLNVVERTVERMETTVEDLNTLTSLGQTVDGASRCDLGEAATQARDRLVVEGEDPVGLRVIREATVHADQMRLERLLENLLRFAAHNGATRVSVEPTAAGFTVTGDGEPLTAATPDDAFDFGGTVPDAGAGTLLPTVRLLSNVQGWDVEIDTEYEDGVRVVFDGVDVALTDEDPEESESGGEDPSPAVG